MKVWNKLDNIMKKISTVCLWISAIVLFVVVAIIFVDVIMRYVFRNPVRGQQELAEMGTVIVVYFGLPFATRIRSHVRVEPITGKLSESARSILYAVLDFLIVAFMAVMAVKVFQQAVILTGQPGNATLILRIPNFYIYYVAAVGAVISCIEFLFDGVRYVREAAGAKKEKNLEKGGAV